jgi:hypothetical protein
MPDGRLMVTLKAGYMEIHDKNGALVKRSPAFPPLFLRDREVCSMSSLIKFRQQQDHLLELFRNTHPANLTAVAKGR